MKAQTIRKLSSYNSSPYRLISCHPYSKDDSTTLTPIAGSVQAIRIVEMQVPPTVQVGKTVHLGCRFDLEGANLYSLNWWRGAEQFFQYSPSSNEKIIVYDSPGITVDVSNEPRMLTFF